MKSINHVPCGKCYACRMNRRMSWTFRLMQQLSVSTSAYFITLTYNDENINENGTLKKVDLQGYIKRIRKFSTFKYFACGEYGSKLKRPHYHILLFDYDVSKVQKLVDSWKEGFPHFGNVEQASIHYVSKDMMKDKTKKTKNGVCGFTLMSKGIGKVGLKNLINKKNSLDFTVNVGNAKINMPRYYKDKIFTDIEKIEQSVKMQKVIDIEFNKYKERFEKNNRKNFFKHLLKEEETLLRLEEKKLKNTKL